MTFSTTGLQNSFGNCSFRSSSSSSHQDARQIMVPHQGSLCRVEGQGETTYVLEILLENESIHELIFRRKDFDFSLRLFSIMDTESRGRITTAIVEEFITLRCPVFWRRDEDLKNRVIQTVPGTSPTFEEVWMAVASCSTSARYMDSDILSFNEIGVEGWMVFCRFIALAQYLEAKRRFLGRHLQQTMRHRNAPRGSELVMVNVPPVAPPVELIANELAQYERENQRCLPLPELDLDHSLLAAHDVIRRRRGQKNILYGSVVGDHVKIGLFGTSPLLLPSNSSSSSLEFCLTFIRIGGDDDDTTTVRRSMSDMKWLNDTFISHKALGGTLCGRILPPFPGNRVFVAAQKDDSPFVSSGGAIAAAANAGVGIATVGVGILKEGIKSLWGDYVSTSEFSSKPYQERGSSKNSSSMMHTMQTYYNPNSPAGKARHLERYFNYILEHPALSTSFPLNTILKASQSGLEAAKQSLEEHTRAAREIKEQTPQMDDVKSSTFWGLYGSGSSMQPNLTWVRTAAQAAVALQLHGILETTGLPSASARLQHASLPSFNNSRNCAWTDDDRGILTRNDSEDTEENTVEDSFEKGVVYVQDELASDSLMEQNDDQGYDLLPLPVPAPERQILNASEVKKNTGIQKQTRFRYGSPPIEKGLTIDSTADEKQVYIGEMVIDENIDKLREVIGSLDNTLSRCMASSCGIERSRGKTFSLHLEILRGLDSWEGLRGKFVSQKALLKGVIGMEQSREVFEESDLTLIDDISWQTLLAHSAVSAAEDVRSTVRAARTAGNAKCAAASAANIAQSVCDKGKFANIEEAHAAQTRTSIAHSHAVHAAVVEHEAKTVKRRATLALAHDVKCWNVHRKREVLQICLAHAKSQHEATRRAVDAWSCLRDGFVGSTVIPSRVASRPTKVCRQKVDFLNGEPEVETTIFGSIDNNDEGQPTIVAVEHEQLRLPMKASTKSANIVDNCTDIAVILMAASSIPEEVDEGTISENKESFAIDNIQNQSKQCEVLDKSGSEHAQSENNIFVRSRSVTHLSQPSEKEMSRDLTFEIKNHTESLVVASSNPKKVDGNVKNQPQQFEVLEYSGSEHAQSQNDTFDRPPGMATQLSQSSEKETSRDLTFEIKNHVKSMVVASSIPEEVNEGTNSENKESFAISDVQNQPQQYEVLDYSGSEHAQSQNDIFDRSGIVTQLSRSSEREMSRESTSENHVNLTSSMQSLVDGLMNWGGKDVEDTFALPTGMAASIALEESIALGNKP
mmetsp:Transcript_1311/g.1490  ORF Transcript_1311/g.1490 Transcript_1311/m.1490 type:complete len:1252 (-) Transcript_1311:570-4325(-)